MGIQDFHSSNCKLILCQTLHHHLAHQALLPAGHPAPNRASENLFNASSNVAFTISHGILDEIYYPNIDIASKRDMEFIITDGKDFFSEEKRDTYHSIKWVEEGIPAFKIVNTCKEKRYTIKKEIITDARRETVLQRIIFKPTKKNDRSKYQLFLILAPHLNDRGENNDGWAQDYKGVRMLFANRKQNRGP